MRLTNRDTVFHRNKTIQIDRNGIEQIRKGRVIKSFPWDQVKRVNLAFLGANNTGGDAAAAYRCRVTSEKGTSIELRNVSFASDDTSLNEDYSKLVCQLHDHLATHGPINVEFRQGSNLYYWLGWIGLLTSCLLLFMIPCFLFMEGGTSILIRKGWIIALTPILAGGTFVPLIRRGRSHPYSPDALPTDHMPSEARPI